eukprot:g2076.t1
MLKLRRCNFFLASSCFNRKEGSTSSASTQVHPVILPARQLQRGESNPPDDDGPANNRVQASSLPSPNEEEEVTRAKESLEAERSLVARFQGLLLQEQEQRRDLSEQVAAANKRADQAEEVYHQAQAWLAEEKEQRRKAEETLRRVTVLRLGDRAEKEELAADRDRYKIIVQDMTSKRLLAGGTNIQAAFPTLLELQADIRKTLTVSVSEWIEDAAPVLHPSISIRTLLPQLFHACQDLVQRHHRGLKTFFVGGAGPACEDFESVMDEATESFMRQHIRRHYRTLFPVTGSPLEKERRRRISQLAGDVLVSATRQQQELGVRHLVASGLEQLVREYLLILVGALLQHPSVEFATDCGMEDVFDPNTHAESIDGDDVGVGEKCIVVFPALLEQGEGGSLQPLNKKYVLPFPDEALAGDE